MEAGSAGDDRTAGPWASSATGPRNSSVRFTGARPDLAGKLFRGLLLFLPTLGLYRFWLVTQKRQFYWANTEIDGDALEYTGNPKQLLIGFLLAVLIFLPLYGLFFYLSTQASDVTIVGYIAVGAFLYLLAGYAAFRSRRFRLTRTLWRGIRFHQTGSAWAYALRNFGWTIVTALTLGLAYPFMATSLWKYQMNNTWYGDRKFVFAGRWKDIAGPFYLMYLVAVLSIGGAFVSIALAAAELPEGNGSELLSGWFLLAPAALFAINYFGYLLVSARIYSRFLSKTSIGATTLSVRVKARALLVQHIVYAICLALVVVIAASGGIAYFSIITGGWDAGIAFDGMEDMSKFLRLGALNLAIFSGLYLAVLGAWSIVGEMFLALGFWKHAANNATLINTDDLRTVRAAGEESSVAGEGLADALNVGSY